MWMCAPGRHPSPPPFTVGSGNRCKGNHGSLHPDLQRTGPLLGRGCWDYHKAQPHPAPNCTKMNEPLEASSAPPTRQHPCSGPLSCFPPSLMPPGYTSSFLATATGLLPEVPCQAPCVGFQGILASLPGPLLTWNLLWFVEGHCTPRDESWCTQLWKPVSS